MNNETLVRIGGTNDNVQKKKLRRPKVDTIAIKNTVARQKKQVKACTPTISKMGNNRRFNIQQPDKN